MSDPSQAAAVVEICQRVEGIALAIELAAARMVSMKPAEVRDRLDDRFRLLSGPRRGLERHQTLRRAIAWSYDLLDDDERQVLMRCAVFAGGFDLATGVAVCGIPGFDEYALLDVMDSLVRKSLATADQVHGHTRYGMLETIRQFAADELAGTGTMSEIRDRHTHRFADQAAAHFELWDGPLQRVAVDWVEVEFANLRAGFRWAADRAELVAATAIAAHTAMMTMPLQRYEPVVWAEEILDAAIAAEVPQLPRLYTGATFCVFAGRAEAAVAYAEAAVALEADPRYEPFETGWAGLSGFNAYRYTGQMDRGVEICSGLAAQPGLAHVVGSCGLLVGLPAIGRADEAMAIAEDTVAAARAHGNPFCIAYALYGYGRIYTQIDPERARRVLREGLVYTQQHRVPYFEAIIARDAAGLEAARGDLEEAMSLLDTAIERFQHAGADATLSQTLAYLAVVFDRFERLEVAATVYGVCANNASIHTVIDLPETLTHLRAALGDATFEKCVADGAGMELADAVGYARSQIQLARRPPEEPV